MGPSPRAPLPPRGLDLSERLPPYRRPELPWERKAEAGPGWGAWASAGIEFGVAVVLFLLGGKALDANLGTTPWCTVIGALLGVAAGMYLLVRTALRPPTPPAKDDRDAPPPPDPGA